MLVVLNRPFNRLDAKTKRGFHLRNEFLIDTARHRVVVEVVVLWLVQTVPRVLLEALNVDSFVRISHKNF